MSRNGPSPEIPSFLTRPMPAPDARVPVATPAPEPDRAIVRAPTHVPSALPLSVVTALTSSVVVVLPERRGAGRGPRSQRDMARYGNVDDLSPDWTQYFEEDRRADLATESALLVKEFCIALLLVGLVLFRRHFL
jgi:hypothetical protein